MGKLRDMIIRQETYINEIKVHLKNSNIRMVYRMLGVVASHDLKKALGK